MARKPKRICLEKLEDWAEKKNQDDEIVVDENLPEYWKQGEDQTTIPEDTLYEGWQHQHDQPKLKSSIVSIIKERKT